MTNRPMRALQRRVALDDRVCRLGAERRGVGLMLRQRTEIAGCVPARASPRRDHSVARTAARR